MWYQKYIAARGLAGVAEALAVPSPLMRVRDSIIFLSIFRRKRLQAQCWLEGSRSSPCDDVSSIGILLSVPMSANPPPQSSPTNRPSLDSQLQQPLEQTDHVSKHGNHLSRPTSPKALSCPHPLSPLPPPIYPLTKPHPPEA